MKTTSNPNKDSFKAHLEGFYGHELPEKEVQLYRNRLVEFFNILKEMDIEQRIKEANKNSSYEPVDPKAALESRIKIRENIRKPITGEETIVVASKFGKELSTRNAAKPLSRRLKSNIKDCIFTKLNFKGVKSSDNSFADEAIAMVLIAAGEDHFNRKVLVMNTNKQVRDRIQYVIEERKKFCIETGILYKYTKH